MHAFPHRYSVATLAHPEGDVPLRSDGLPSLASAPPTEFGGPGDRWSPETLLVASVADCFVLSFRSVARASKFSWLSLRCDVEGTLDRVDRVTQFTGFAVRASLLVPSDANEEQAKRLMARAEQLCLITNSLKAASHLEAEVEFGEAPQESGSTAGAWPESLDALVAAPEHHTLLFENPQVRVLDTHIAPGRTTPVHTHRWSSALYVLGWSDFVRRDGQGQVLVDTRTAGAPAEPATALWSGPLPPHSLENVGRSDIHIISVELKGSGA